MNTSSPSDSKSTAHSEEIASGKRFEFGKNWAAFLTTLNDERIAEAEKSLQEMLGVKDLKGKRFLDAGSGSGLFSLAARRLGASVHSFDFDPQSVACTRELRRRYFEDDASWQVEEGSVLDETYVAGLGQHDIVYSWGVLHHTGDMATALLHAGRMVAPGGALYIAIYNQQGYKSKVWRKLKQIYCGGLLGRMWVTALGSTYFFLVLLKEDLVRLRNPFTRYREYKKNRGMSMFTDWIDWFGGYPFEVAKPEEIFDCYTKQGFELRKLVTMGGNLGCNEFVFQRSQSGEEPGE